MSSGLPVISGKEAVKAFEKAGCKFVRIGSSRHMIMKKEGVFATLSIPDHKALAVMMGSLRLTHPTFL